MHDYIAQEINKAVKKGIINPTEFSIIVFCTYVLSFYSKPTANSKEPLIYKNIVSALFKSKFCTFEGHIEQNIEYWYNHNNYYIRIPWQLYLIALAAKHTPSNFSKVEIQNMLSEIYKTIDSKNAYIYEYSGPYFSTRTNSILCEVCLQIKNNLKNDIRYHLLFYWFQISNKIELILGKWYVRWFIKIAMITIFVFTIYKWITKDTVFSSAQLSDLGPEIIGPILYGLYYFSTKRK